MVNLRWGWSEDEDVVHIDKNIERACSDIVKGGVGLGPMKAKIEESPNEFAKPLPGGLFEAIEGFSELVNMMRVVRMMEAGRLLHIYQVV